jgi:ectoine hydroxylase-related dioxygenase (phytanoyl-CoA dioxygenase family)
MQETKAMTLSAAQVKEYWDKGYLIVPGLLTHEEVDSFVDYENEPKPAEWRSNLRHHADNEQWAYIAKHPNVTSIARQLLNGARPMIVQSMYLEKKPAGDGAVGGSGIALHQDLHYLPCEPDALMACWVALSDTDGENGGLCVVPGSNQRGDLYETSRANNLVDHDSWEFEYDMRDRDGKVWKQRMYSFEIPGVSEADVVRLTVPKGDGVFFTGKTIHGSYGNRSRDRYRRAFATHFVPEGAWLFRQDVQELVPAV